MLDAVSIPNGWRDDTIADHVKFEGGTQPPRSTFIFKEKPGYIRLVQTRDFKTDAYKTYIPVTSNHKTFCESDIMIGRYGPPVFQIYRGLSGAYNVALIKAAPRTDEINPNYLYYTLCQDRLFNLIDSLSRRSSGQTGVDVDALKSFPLPLPPLSEQRKIAEILRMWDEAIDACEQLIERKQNRLASARQHIFGRDGLPPDKWPSAKLASLVERIQRQSDGGEHPVMTISGKLGFRRQDEKFARFMAGESVSRYLLLKRGEFAYNKGNSKTFPQGCIYRLAWTSPTRDAHRGSGSDKVVLRERLDLRWR